MKKFKIREIEKLRGKSKYFWKQDKPNSEIYTCAWHIHIYTHTYLIAKKEHNFGEQSEPKY